MLGVKSDHAFNSWVGKPPVAGTAQVIAGGLAASAWMRLLAGEGTKGARLYDWATANWPISRASTTVRLSDGREAC